MPTHYRVALHGFSEFERKTLTYCLRQAAAREPGYVQVEPVADADFIVADANHPVVAGHAIASERMADTLFIGDLPPPGAGVHLPRPIDPERILRTLDRMAARRARRLRNARPGIALPLDTDSPRFSASRPGDIVDTTPAGLRLEPVSISFAELKPLGEADPPAAQEGAMLEAANASRATSVPTATDRRATKAAAKRASRRARLAQSAADAADTPHDVLLLDASPEPVALGLLLEMFGFRVQRVGSIAAAMSLLERTPLAAAFIDADAQDATGFDGLHLCHRIKHRLVPLARAVPAVMLMSTHDSAAERVRASLAGCDAFLTLPVTRGDAARALESCKIALPSDPRRP
jgi:CheY-like chemotaxis protein